MAEGLALPALKLSMKPRLSRGVAFSLAHGFLGAARTQKHVARYTQEKGALRDPFSSQLAASNRASCPFHRRRPDPSTLNGEMDRYRPTSSFSMSQLPRRTHQLTFSQATRRVAAHHPTRKVLQIHMTFLVATRNG